VIYTSGSTGRPKGVMTEHRGVLNFLRWHLAEFGIGAGDRLLHQASASFDVSVWEMFAPLMSGATVVIARPDGQRDPGYLARLIREQGVTMAQFMPSMLRLFLAEPAAAQCRSLRQVLSGSEELPPATASLVSAVLPGVLLGNEYGPTEATVGCVAFWVRPGDEPPSGVVFILVTARIDRLLPTIISRCRQWPMSLPATEPAVAWLAQQGVERPAALLAEAGGAPLTALALATDENRALRDFALAQLAAGPACDAFACGENLQKLPVPMVLGWLQRWLYDLLAQKTAGRPRYFPAASKALERCAAQIDTERFARFQKTVTRQRAVENHPLNARLVFEELFLGYRDVFNAA